ncbi:11578_t:CDS:10, partial [Acaulospora morrowiae]
IAVDDPTYFTFDHEWSLLNFLSYRQKCIDFRFNKQKEHERYVRSLTAILNWKEAPDIAIEWANKALAIVQKKLLYQQSPNTPDCGQVEKKSQSITKFWENVASVENQMTAAIARRNVIMEEHTNTVIQSVFKQDQIVRDMYARHLDDKRQEVKNLEDVLLNFFLVQKRYHVNISNKTQDMMENMTEETVKAHLDRTKSSSKQQLSNLLSDRGYCSKCHMKINISGPMRFCPYCGSKVASFDVTDFEEFESDNDEPVEPDEADENKDDEGPPKIDKLAFREAHHAIPDNAKMHLKSGKIVEDVLFDFAKDMEHEHHAHSYIINYDDENVKALFTETEWNELTEDRIRIPAVPCEIGEELVRYGKKKTLSELRNSVLTSYLKDGAIYDINKHYNQEWIQMVLRTLVNLYENLDSSLIRNQYENWFTVTFLETFIDLCMRDIQLCTDIKRTDAPSLASANRKSRGRSGNTKTRILTGRKIDGIVYIVDRNIEVGAIEAAGSFSGVSDRKYLLETFKMPKTLRDMYADLVRTANYDEQKANNLQVFGILHLGLSIQFTRLYRAGGSICIFRKDAVSHHVDSKFSEDGIKSFLKLMVAIYQHKLIIRDNLHTLNIRNANTESGDDYDLLNDILGVGNYSTSQSSIERFADSWPTSRKKKRPKSENLKKRNVLKKRRL